MGTKFPHLNGSALYDIGYIATDQLILAANDRGFKLI